ncbi:hypothetical protein DID88_008467 [Monilinia fructigena]|uniref:CST complex subunit Stn1 N-terminal domain-containing protein n=1 Tax=Monilinia fructigena TaxID=38457 RepID=A0A395J6I9_9HELO|nr:hypothetical protein DID88_008467 [Monilinia fructigena]
MDTIWMKAGVSDSDDSTSSSDSRLNPDLSSPFFEYSQFHVTTRPDANLPFSHDAPEENVMTTSSSTSNLAPLQPPNLYHLSPTYQKWCALRCADIITLKDRKVYVEGKLIHHHLNHPIRYIKLLGLIVSIVDFAHRRVYTIDDSSGACIECVALLPPRNASAPSNPPTSTSTSTSASHPPLKPQRPGQPPRALNRAPPDPVGRHGRMQNRAHPRRHGHIYDDAADTDYQDGDRVGNTELERKWWDEETSSLHSHSAARKKTVKSSPNEENPQPKPKPKLKTQRPTHPPTSTSTFTSKSTPNPKPAPPPKKGIIPVALTDLAKFDTFGL